MTTQAAATGLVTTNPYPAGQCTWGVWQYIHDNFGVDMPDLSGNADSWVSDAQAKGWTVSQNPTADTVAVWGTDMYPDGHVAFVTKVDLSGGSSTNPAEPNTNVTSDFVVYEANFKKTAPYPPPGGTNGYDYVDTRTIQMGSKEASSVKGFIELSQIGIQPGTGAQITPGSNTSPWADLAAGITSAEKSLQTELDQAVKKAEAGAQIVAGLMVMGGGVYFLQAGLRGQSPIPTVPRARMASRRPLGRSEGLDATSAAELREAEANEALLQGGRRYHNVSARQLAARNRELPQLEGARDFVLGQQSNVEASALRKLTRGRMGDLTPVEQAWAQANEGAVRQALRASPARVTSAGRTRTL